MPFDRKSTHKPAKPTVFGYNPEGKELMSYTELPRFVNFEEVIIRGRYISIDGWVLLNDRHSKGGLQWLHHNMVTWMAAHPEEDNQDWMNGIVATFEWALKNQLNEDPENP